jgi:hypothetical protein
MKAAWVEAPRRVRDGNSRDVMQNNAVPSTWWKIGPVRAFDFKYFSSCDLGTIFRQLMFCYLKIPMDKNLDKESSIVAAFHNGLAKIGKSEARA